MQYRLLSILSAIFICALASGQSRTIIIHDDVSPYHSQSWFSRGKGRPTDSDKIRSYWDAGKYITSMAYTEEGWFTVASKGAGMSRQRYKKSVSWPKDWIREGWDLDLYISQVSSDGDEWMVVMSKGENYTGQSWKRDRWSAMRLWIHEKWEEGKYITASACDGEKWVVVMSRHPKFLFQGYFWARNYKDLVEKVDREVWGRNFALQSIEYGQGAYLVVYGLTSGQRAGTQSFDVNPANIKSYISGLWERGRSITYMGGGAPFAEEVFQGALPAPEESCLPPMVATAHNAYGPGPVPPGHSGSVPPPPPGHPGHGSQPAPGHSSPTTPGAYGPGGHGAAVQPGSARQPSARPAPTTGSRTEPKPRRRR